MDNEKTFPALSASPLAKTWDFDLGLRDYYEKRSYKDIPLLVYIVKHHENEFDRCLGLARTVVEKHPDFDVAYFWLATLLKDCGELDQAEEILKCGLRKSRRYSQLFVDLGILYLEQEKSSDAVQCMANSAISQHHMIDDNRPYLFLAAMSAQCRLPALGQKFHDIAQQIEQTVHTPEYVFEIKKVTEIDIVDNTNSLCRLCEYLFGKEEGEILLHQFRDEAAEQGLALLSAVHVGDLSAARLAISRGADVEFFSQLDRSQSQPLLAAVFPDPNLEMIKILLEAGANPNCHNGSNTASGLAARSGDLDALKLLIDAGADPKSIAPNGTDDALSWARGMGHEHIVAYLEGKGVANTNWLWMLAAIVVIVLIISVNLG